MAAIDLRAKVLDLLIGSGDTWSWNLNVSSSTGEPLNLIGYTISAYVVPSVGAPVSILLPTDNTHLEAGSFFIGQEEATISGFYSVKIIDLNGAGTTYLKGNIVLS